MLHPLSATYLADPYATHEKLRTEQPVFFDTELNMWLITRRQEIETVFKDSKTFSNALTTAPIFQLCPHAGQILSQLSGGSMVSLDPPDHTRVRKAIASVFPMTLAQAEEYEPIIRTAVDKLTKNLATKSNVDLVPEFTWELPIIVILALLNVPKEDVKQIKKWADGRLAITWGNAPEEDQVKAAYGMVYFWEYCLQLVGKRVKEPGTDLVSKLLNYRQGRDEIVTIHEIASMIFSLLIAGHETTSNLISNGVYRLLQKNAWNQLVNDPEKISKAIEEILRFDSPVVCWQRYTAKEATIGDVTIPKGERVLLLLGSANRDETKFENPNEFDLERENAHEHLSFGKGRHFCIGASLARLEAKIALKALLTTFPKMRLADSFQPTYVPNVAFRMLQSLPVILADE